MTVKAQRMLPLDHAVLLDSRDGGRDLVRKPVLRHPDGELVPDIEAVRSFDVGVAHGRDEPDDRSRGPRPERRHILGAAAQWYRAAHRHADHAERLSAN